MNINIDNEILNTDEAYLEFLRNNPGRGFLKIRATSASEAVPIDGLEITVSKEIGDNNIIFFDGRTDESGMINGIILPTPPKVSSDLVAPNFADYRLHAKYSPENFDKNYVISICCSVSVIQYINVTPNISPEMGDNSGS